MFYYGKKRHGRDGLLHFAVMILVMALCLSTVFTPLGCIGSGTVYADSAQASGSVNASGGASLRAKASAKSRQVAMLADNSGVTIMREVFTSKSTKANKRWYYVSASGKTGYVRADLVDGISYANIPASTTAKITYRNGPSTGMKKKGTLSRGSAVTVQLEAKKNGSKGTWYRVSVNGGSYFVDSKYIKFGGSSQASASSAPAAISDGEAASALAGTTVTGQRNPQTLEAGRGFTIRGTVSSPLPMSRVTVGVTKAGGQWVLSRSYDINSRSFDIYTADKDLKFGTLASGSYTYRVDVTIGSKTATKLSVPFNVTANKLVGGLLSNPTSGGRARYVYTFDSSNCRKLFSVTGFSKAVVPQGMAFTGAEYYIVYGMKAMQAIVTYSASGQKTKSGGFAFNMGHPNGMTWDPETGLCYIFKGNQKTIYTWNPSTNKYGKSKTPYSSSGVAYDKGTRNIYATSQSGVRVYSADGSFSHKQLIKRCSHGIKHYIQDCGAQNGFIFHGVSGRSKHKTNFLDVYRESDGMYLGSIRITLGEIESIVVGNDGFVQLLVNSSGKTDYVWKTPLNVNDLK